MINSNLLSFTTGGVVTATLRYGNLYSLSQVPSQTAVISQPQGSVSLSRRQADVLRLIVQGCSNKQIARTLGLAQGTVKIHVAALFHKLGATSRTAAAVAGTRLLAQLASDPPASQRREIRGAYPFGPASLASAA